MAKSDEQLEKKSKPAAKPRATSQGNGNGYTHRFVSLELTTETKAQFKALVADGEFDRSTIDEFLNAGYSVRFSQTDGGATVVCTVTCSVEGDPNYGLMLSGRGGDSTTAFRVCLFKDTYLCENGAWAAGELTARQAGGDIG